MLHKLAFVNRCLLHALAVSFKNATRWTAQALIQFPLALLTLPIRPFVNTQEMRDAVKVHALGIVTVAVVVIWVFNLFNLTAVHPLRMTALGIGVIVAWIANHADELFEE